MAGLVCRRAKGGDVRFRDISLSTRITLVAVLLVVAGGVLWVDKENKRLHEAYLAEREADLKNALDIEKSRLLQSIETLRQDVTFLANTPPISGMARASANNGIDPRDKNSYATWEGRMQEIFASFLQAHPDYYQARFIGVADNGKELVRVENMAGRVEVAQHGLLQTQGDRDYFKAGLNLTLGRVYLSGFSLNQEFGKIVEPHRPTLRAVTPVFDAGGHVFGMVVINMDMGALFAASAIGLPTGSHAYIADQEGHYLFHPDAKHAFAFEFGEKGGISDDFPTLKPLLEPNTQQQEVAFHALADKASGHLLARRVFFDSSEPSRFLLLAYLSPPQGVAEHSFDVPLPNLIDTALVAVLMSGVFMLVLRYLLSPLKRITLTAREIAAGNRQVRLAERGMGEIGKLSEALNLMLGKLMDGEASERENAFRKELIESLPGIFYMIDTQGHFLMWNRNLEKLSTQDPKDFALSHPLDYFEGEDKVRVESAIRQVFEEGEASLEAVFVSKDGTQTPHHFTGRRVLRDGEWVLIGMGLDISEQRENARVREALWRRNQVLMQNSMEGVHVMDIEGNALEVNAAFCRMLGYTREEALRLNVRDWNGQFSAAELSVRFHEFIGKSSIFETLYRRKDGSLLDVEICATGVEIDGKGYLFAASRDITERKRMQAVSQRHHQVIETAMDGYWMTDAQGYLEEVNAAYAKMSGYTVQELVGMHISQLEASEHPEDVGAHIAKIMAQGYDRFETQHRRKDGRVVDIEISTTYMADVEKFFVFCHNITQRKQVEQELRIAAATFETHEAILITDAQSTILRVNRAFSEITGYAAEEVIGKNPRIMSSGKHDRAFYLQMWQQLLSVGSWAGEIWDKRKNGEIFPKWMSITAVKNERQETLQYVAIFSDITERKRVEQEIHNLAFYDTLTQLPNRRLFIERLRATLPASSRRRDYGAVLFLDMDRFKSLNDTLGHDYGDMMLIEVASRIKACVREMDTVARLGGDEFVVLIESLSADEQDASRQVGIIAAKIREALAQPYRLREHEHHSSPSIGIALYRGNEESADVLLRHADLAMYQAKNAGGNSACFFDPGMRDNASCHDTVEESPPRQGGNAESE